MVFRTHRYYILLVADSGFLRTLDSSIKRNTAVIKKLKQINEEQRESLMDDLRSVNLSKFVSEAVTAICDAKLRSSDIQAAVQVHVNLNCCILYNTSYDFSLLTSLSFFSLKVLFFWTLSAKVVLFRYIWSLRITLWVPCRSLTTVLPSAFTTENFFFFWSSRKLLLRAFYFPGTVSKNFSEVSSFSVSSMCVYFSFFPLFPIVDMFFASSKVPRILVKLGSGPLKSLLSWEVWGWFWGGQEFKSHEEAQLFKTPFGTFLRWSHRRQWHFR